MNLKGKNESGRRGMEQISEEGRRCGEEEIRRCREQVTGSGWWDGGEREKARRLDVEEERG